MVQDYNPIVRELERGRFLGFTDRQPASETEAGERSCLKKENGDTA